MQDENMSSHSADANEASLHEDKHDEDATKDGLPQALVSNLSTISTVRILSFKYLKSSLGCVLFFVVCCSLFVLIRICL